MGVVEQVARLVRGEGTMTDIRGIEDIQQLVRAGERDWRQYGEVNAVYHEGLVLFNYTQACQYMGRWNWFELNSRGLILDATTGEIVARPFRKFFNYGEHMPMPGTHMVEITEKLDGSLGILYFHRDAWRIATRGSFTSEQAQWATDWLYRHLTRPLILPEGFTLLFEIIYPANRIVVNYGDFEGLALIGARHRQFGHEMYAAELDVLAGELGVMRPKTFTFSRVEDILDAAAQLSANEEGWVIRYSDNERYKVKGDAYKLAHRILTGLSFGRVLDAVEQGKYDAMIEGVPDEFLAQVKAWKREIDDGVATLTAQLTDALAQAPSGTQKDFALWVQATQPKAWHGYLFSLRQGKDITPAIYKHHFERRRLLDTTPETEL